MCVFVVWRVVIVLGCIAVALQYLFTNPLTPLRFFRNLLFIPLVLLFARAIDPFGACLIFSFPVLLFFRLATPLSLFWIWTLVMQHYVLIAFTLFKIPQPSHFYSFKYWVLLPYCCLCAVNYVIRLLIPFASLELMISGADLLSFTFFAISFDIWALFLHRRLTALLLQQQLQKQQQYQQKLPKQPEQPPPIPPSPECLQTQRPHDMSESPPAVDPLLVIIAPDKGSSLLICDRLCWHVHDLLTFFVSLTVCVVHCAGAASVSSSSTSTAPSDDVYISLSRYLTRSLLLNSALFTFLCLVSVLVIIWGIQLHLREGGDSDWDRPEPCPADAPEVISFHTSPIPRCRLSFVLCLPLLLYVLQLVFFLGSSFPFLFFQISVAFFCLLSLSFSCTIPQWFS